MDYDRTNIPEMYKQGRDHGPAFLEQWMRVVATYVEFTPVHDILDLGCGTGRFSGGLAVHFNARIMIMDEPTAALGPAETGQVRNLVRQLKEDGIGIFLISHDIHDVFDLSDRISVMYHGRIVGTVNQSDVTTDDVLGMIILGKKPEEVTQKELDELHA